jgi:hypothetical protein
MYEGDGSCYHVHAGLGVAVAEGKRAHFDLELAGLIESVSDKFLEVSG